MSNIYFKKDFYYYLPKYLTNALEEIISIHGEKDWFPEAWEEYRHMAKTLGKRHLPMPYKFFGEKDSANKLPEKEVMETQITKYLDNDVSTTEEVFKKHYEENFQPTVQEQVRRDFKNGKNKKFHKKNHSGNF